MLVGTNLIGLIVRGIRTTYKKDSEGNLISMGDTSSNGSIIMTVIFSLVSVLYFYVLYHYWNAGIMICGLILMFSRLPDLLFEMKTGIKINPKNMPKTPFNIVVNIISWLVFPLIYFSFCYWK